MSTLVVDVAAATTRPLTTRWWSAYVTATGTGSAPSAVEALVAPGATSAFVNAQWLQLWFLFASLAVLAYMTNPSPATFRTHLTSLSFHTHLRRLSSSFSQSSSSHGDVKSVTAAISPSSSNLSTLPKAPNCKMDAKTPNIFSFSNRISLSVRTPSYHFKSYGLFSVVVMPLSPLSPTNTPNASTSATLRLPSAVTTATATTSAHPSVSRRKKGSATQATGLSDSSTDFDILRADVWIGAFGRWFAWKWDAPTGMTPIEVTENDERRERVSRSVIKSTTEDAPSKRSSKVPKPLTLSSNPAATSTTSDDPTSPTEPPTSPTTRVGRSSRPAKRPLRGMQRRTSPNSLARLRSQVESNAAAAAAAASAAQGPDKANRVSKEDVKKVAARSAAAAKDEEGLRSTKDGPTLDDEETTVISTTDDPSTTTTGRTNGSSEDRVVQELQLQVEELRTSTDDSERRLQEELEVLRGRKKDEDTSRQELKQRTKMLEEQKRVAELHRTEAERELNERKSVVRAAQHRVDKMRNEISEIEKKELEVTERREKKKRDRKERERKLKEDVEKRKEELKKVEEGVNELADQVASLERCLDGRREVLQARRHEIVARNMGLGRNEPAQAYPYAQPTGVMSRWRGGAVGYPHGGAYAYSNNNSRPGSVRSGHFDHYHSNYQSAPSSPVQSSPITPFDDPALGAPRPAVMASNLGPDAHRPPTTQGFLEHRLQHRRQDPATGDGTLSSAFLPFDFDTLDAPASSGSRPASIHSPPDDANKGRPALALPLQYLDSGLLAGGDSPGINGPLSPMTPHQTSLIPSTLFHMLDEDDEDEGQFGMPDSPSITAANGDSWKGFDLDLANDLTIGRSNRARDASLTRAADSGLGVNLLRRDSKSSGVKSPFSDGQSLIVVGSRSAVSSPALVPASTSATITTTTPASSSFAPWDAPAEGMHVSKPSPMEQQDDLPRAGLSLNPDAKAFAFSPRATSATIPASSSTNLLPTLVKGRSASNPPFPTSIVASNSISASGPSSLTVVDPFSPSFNSVVAPPQKLRMDFGHRLSSSGHSSLGSRFAFDAWASSPVTPSPEATSYPSALKSNFNPFADDGDDFLEPLKK